MDDSRREVIVVFEPLDGTAWRHLSRPRRAELLRSDAQRRVEEMLDDLRRAGMAEDVDILESAAGRSVPAGTVLVKATPRALKMIRKIKGVAAVADVDTPLAMWPLTA